MNLFCPNCEAAYAGASICPKCNGRLITPAEAFTIPTDLPALPPSLIRPTAAARVAVGTLVGLGVYFAGRDWALAIALPSGDSAAALWWTGPTGVIVGYVLRALAATVGGLLGGAGRPQGAMTGLLTGVAVGGVFLMMDTPPGKPVGVPALVAFGVAIVLAAAAGIVGSRMWSPAAEQLLADVGGSRGSSLAKLAEAQKQFDEDAVRPTRWVRIVLATALAVLGVIYADAVRDRMKAIFAGGWNLGSPTRIPMYDLEIAGTAVVVAGLIAGAGTGAGLRHGFIMGVLTVAGVFGLAARQGETAIRPLIALLEAADMNPDLGSSQAMGTIGGVILATCLFSGWLSGQLLPPLAPQRMRSRKLAIS